MYKPPKNNESAQPQQQRVKLALMNTMPNVKQVRSQLDEGTMKRGTIIEQQWTTKNPNQTFNLMVQWDKTAENPIWTLYEENGADSKMHWSQPFAPSDIDMLFDILSMSAETQSTAKIPDSLKPKEFGEKPGGGLSGSILGARASSMSHLSPDLASAAPVQPEPPAPMFPTAAPAQAYPPQAPAPAYPPPAPAQNYPQQQQAPAYPQQQQAPGYPPQQQPYPQQQAPAYPQQAPGYPQQQPNYPPDYGHGQTPYPPVAPVQPPPGYGYGGYPPQQAPGGYPPPPNPYPQQQQGGSIWQSQTNHDLPAQSSSVSSLPPELSPVKGGVPLDYDRSKSGTNILLGTLLFEAGLINKPTLDAALKIQDMVREAKVSVGDAPETLKRLHDMGGSIEQYVNSGEIKKSSRPSQAASQGRSGTNAEQIAEQRAAFDLLQKAGLLKEDDLKNAASVRNKHGGDMVQILQAAGKMDLATYKAASTCVPLIRDNKMKVEQCIIAVNYCNRSRVDFETALEELNWPNPLK